MIMFHSLGLQYDYYTIEMDSSYGFASEIAAREKEGFELLSSAITQQGKWCAIMKKEKL
jgi:hypothetical protein